MEIDPNDERNRALARGIQATDQDPARRWLDEVIAYPGQRIEAIAARENRSPRSVRLTLSLAFLSPKLVKAALEGRLPRGLNARRMTEMPMLWPAQWRELGIQSPTADDA